MPRIIDKRCSVCKDPAARTAVDRLVREGKSQTGIAEQVGRSRQAVQRHLAHLKRAKRADEKSRAARSAPGTENSAHAGRKAGSRRKRDDDGRCRACGLLSEGIDAQTLLRRTEWLVHAAETIVVDAQSDGDSRLALMAVDRANKALETLARATGLIGSDGVTVNVAVDARKAVLNELVAPMGEQMLGLVANGVSADEWSFLASVLEERRAQIALPAPATATVAATADS